MGKRIGQLRECVRLFKQNDEPEDNPSGNDREFYVEIAARYAAVDPIGSGARYLRQANLSDGSTHQIWIRHDEDLENRGIIDHVIFKDRMFEIMNIIIEKEADRFLILEVRELSLVGDRYDLVELP